MTAQEDKRWLALRDKLLPAVRGLMTKDVTARATGARVRKLRPPLVIKALLDMKGDTLSAADPLTLGMLERLEGIVKVREQMKFNVKHGRCAAAAQFGAQFGGAIRRDCSDARSFPSTATT